jgi:hypothetical protein
MKLPSPEFSISSKLATHIESSLESEKLSTKQNIINHTISAVAASAFALLDFAYNALSAVVKAPLILFGRATTQEVGSHLDKAWTFLLAAPFLSIIGGIDPDSLLNLYRNLGITKEEEGSFSEESSSFSFETEWETFMNASMVSSTSSSEESISSKEEEKQPEQPSEFNAIAREILSSSSSSEEEEKPSKFQHSLNSLLVSSSEEASIEPKSHATTHRRVTAFNDAVEGFEKIVTPAARAVQAGREQLALYI